MSFLDLIKTAWYSIRAYKLRIFLTMIGIIIGISSVSAILAVGQGLSKEATSSLDSSNLNDISISYNQGFDQDAANISPFNEQDIAEIEKIEGVKKVEKNKQVELFKFDFFNFSFFDKNANGSIIPYEKSRDVDLESGLNFTEEEGNSNDKKIILGYGTATKLFSDPMTAIGYAVSIPGKGMYEVIGVRKEPNMEGVNISFDTDFDSTIVAQ
ncbi:MAG: ABC transporter permease [Andreesenia angusta]|nr:ABC transporter permease [Andreesenia angusta]